MEVETERRYIYIYIDTYIYVTARYIHVYISFVFAFSAGSEVASPIAVCCRREFLNDSSVNWFSVKVLVLRF